MGISLLVFSCFIVLLGICAQPSPEIFFQNGKPKISCDDCVKIATHATKIAENSTDIKEIISLLDMVCRQEFKNLSDCEALAGDIINLLPELDRQLTTLAWNVDGSIPLGICAVFVPVCPMPCCDATYPYLPEQLRLSITGDLSEMMVTWTSLYVPPSGLPSVSYREAGSATWVNITALNRTYTEGGWIGQIYSAKMVALRPGSLYDYFVGSEEGISQIRTFRVFPTNIGTTARPLRIAQVGDMDWAENSNDTINSLIDLAGSGQIDLFIHSGDVSYADGYMPHWDLFLRKIENLSSVVPYMTGPGNHELWYNFKAYKTRWTMPNFEHTQNMFYSVNVGTLHLSMINTETFLDTGNIDVAQNDWIKRDMAAINRTQTPWLIAAGHRPLYCTTNTKEDCGKTAAWLRDEVETVYYKNKVNLVIQSHVHNMERSLPVYKGEVMSTNYTRPGAPTYLVSGNGGNRESSDTPALNKPWAVKGFKGWGFTLMFITEDMLKVELHAGNSTLLDEFTLLR